MKLVAFTIVLNGMPFIASILSSLNRLKLDWHWVIVEGAAKNVACSSHCTQIEPQISTDGTHDWLKTVENHKRVTVLDKVMWEGKIAMVNAAMEQIRDECVLLQIDADEHWTTDQLRKIWSLLKGKEAGAAAKFYCRYFVGPGLVVTGCGENVYGNRHYEWVRAWRFSPGMKFKSHCPPVLEQQHIVYDRPDTLMSHLVFDHYSWTTPQQAEFKTKFYGHQKSDWAGLQLVREFPVKLKQYLPWVDEDAEVVQI